VCLSISTEFISVSIDQHGVYKCVYRSARSLSVCLSDVDFSLIWTITNIIVISNIPISLEQNTLGELSELKPCVDG